MFIQYYIQMLTGIVILLLVLGLFAFFVRRAQRKKKESRRQAIRQGWGKEKEASRDFEKIALYQQHQQALAENKEAFLNKQTAADLHIEEVFARIDRCYTPVGQQYLYQLLHSPCHSQAVLEERNRHIRFFQQEEAVREAVAVELSQLSGRLSYALPNLMHQWELGPGRWSLLCKILGIVPVLWIGLSLIEPVFLFLLFASFFVNIFVHYSQKRRLDFFLDPFTQLIHMRRSSLYLSRLHPLLQKEKVSAACKQMEPISQYYGLLASGKSHQNELSALFTLLLEYLKISFLLEVNVLDRCIVLLASRKKAVHELYRFTGEIDAFLSVASFREGLPYYCEPRFTEGAEASLATEEVYHPLVENCQPNSLHLQGQGAVISGSNMSGKTTFIRTLSLNALLAQTVYTVLARGYEATFFAIHTSISIKDDLTKGSSYYLEEIESVHALLQQSRSSPLPQLLAIDELFKGTNTTERIAAARAVLLYLNQPSTMVLVSTHDLELASLLKDSYRQYHFSESIRGGELRFDHQLKEGPLRSRNAIRLLELTGYPATIVQAAQEYAGLLPEEPDNALA